jgi:hypothetical protein
MLLDTRTLVIVAVFVALVPGLIGALVWQTRQTYPGRWTLGNLLGGLTLLLLSLRGTVPDWISIVLANVLAVVAAILFLQGIRRFRGLPLHGWVEWMAGLVAIAAVIYFRYVTNNINVRILVMSLAMGSIGLACGITLLKQVPSGRRLSMIFTGIVFLLGGTVHLIRGVYVYAFAPVTNLFDPSGANAVLFMAASLGVIGWSFGFILMTAERLEVEPKAAQNRTSVVAIQSNAPAQMSGKTVPAAEVRQQLQRIILSDGFRKSARMERFLTLTVERTLTGRPEELKEYALGRDVFNRDDAYDPRLDSIVRVEAQRLRRKLREYYESCGRDDVVMVEFRSGSYVPSFRYREIIERDPTIQSPVES